MRLQECGAWARIEGIADGSSAQAADTPRCLSSIAWPAAAFSTVRQLRINGPTFHKDTHPFPLLIAVGKE